ncbi:MAG: hypothetical protein B6D63_04035 [Candidatus Latescibacteria bacterium 4484_7]|nr:MAG: hypothetical protein B6D63_04035 [Candidatus Latescibacteria bacterium 4484_7]
MMQEVAAMRTISIINQKGGCGKTTVAINLTAALSELAKRVLLVDLDPQAHATIGLNINYDDSEYTTYDLLKNPRVKLADAVVQVDDDLFLVPSSPVLSAVEHELAGVHGRELKLLSKISRHPEEYDYIIIDSPPNIGLLTFNALMATKEVLIPVDPSYFSLNGLQKLKETLTLLEKETKHRVKVNVLLNNLEKRTAFVRDVVGEVDRLCNAEVLDTTISHSVRFKEAALRGIPIFKMSKVDRLQREFLSLAKEIDSRASVIDTEGIDDWMVRLHGPRRIKEGVLFVLDAPNARSVYLTGEFNNWVRDGIRMEKDENDGIWKVVLDLEPGEYEYRFIVDGVWIKDPSNTDSVLNEFGQENSLLIV